MNHELRGTQGVVRRHGKIGAFVSELEIDSGSFEVEEGRDLIDPDISYWDYPSQTYRGIPSSGGPNPRDPSDTFLVQAAEFQRFCSSRSLRPGSSTTAGPAGATRARSTSPTRRAAMRAGSSE